MWDIRKLEEIISSEWLTRKVQIVNPTLLDSKPPVPATPPHPNVQTKPNNLCFTLLIRHLPLHPKLDTYFLHTKNSTGLGTPINCKWRHTGIPEMLLLSSPVVMDSSWLSSHEPDHQQSSKWPLEGQPPLTSCPGLKHIQEMHTRSLPCPRWIFYTRTHTPPGSGTHMGPQH